LYYILEEDKFNGVPNGVVEWADITLSTADSYLFQFKTNVNTGAFNGFYLRFNTRVLLPSRNNNFSADGSTFLSQGSPTTASLQFVSSNIRVVVF